MNIEIYGGLWCASCAVMKPEVVALAMEHDVSWTYFDVDVPEFKERARALGFRSIPAVALVHGTQVVWQASGTVDLRALAMHIGLMRARTADEFEALAQQTPPPAA